MQITSLQSHFFFCTLSDVGERFDEGSLSERVGDALRVVLKFLFSFGGSSFLFLES